MIARIVTALLCSSAPLALSAQQVNLTSPDEFISVDGEIVGFNGVMLRVETLVGTVSVPASEVICYGEACLEVLANNAFGLTADQLAGVVAATAAAEASQPSTDELTIGFATSTQNAFYTSFAAGVSGVQVSGTSVSLSGGTSLAVTDDGATADVSVQTVSLEGGADAAAAGPSAWSTSTSGLTHQMLALDALTVQMSPSTGLGAISIDDLSRVLSGEVTNWSEIGGADMAVLALRLPDAEPLSSDLASVVLAPAGREMSPAVLIIGDEAGIAASVNQFPGSIAVISTRSADPTLTVPVTGTCGLSVAPTPFNIISGDYPLVRPVMATYAAAPGADLVSFFDAAASDSGQAVGLSEGMVDFSAVPQDSTVKNARLNGLLTAALDDTQRISAASMFESLLPAQRLSTTFVGGSVSGPEAAWNRAMMVDLVETLADPQYAGREIIFVGLGSSDAGSQAALANSVQSAAEMLAAYQSFAGGSAAAAVSFGFGDVAPATCVDGQAAGSDATRVEVWVR